MSSGAVDESDEEFVSLSSVAITDDPEAASALGSDDDSGGPVPVAVSVSWTTVGSAPHPMNAKHEHDESLDQRM